MARPRGSVYVAEISKRHKNKVYTYYLLRCAYREGGKVHQQTLANLSHLPREAITHLQNRSGRGRPFPLEALVVERRALGGAEIVDVHVVHESAEVRGGQRTVTHPFTFFSPSPTCFPQDVEPEAGDRVQVRRGLLPQRQTGPHPKYQPKSIRRRAAMVSVAQLSATNSDGKEQPAKSLVLRTRAS